jgi:hypothetical protein
MKAECEKKITKPNPGYLRPMPPIRILKRFWQKGGNHGGKEKADHWFESFRKTRFWRIAFFETPD